MLPYIFVAATILAVIPKLFLYKINVTKLKEDPSASGEVQKNFFIGVAIAEALPIILFVYGFMELENTTLLAEDLYVPAVIIVFTALFAIFFMFLQMRTDVTKESKAVVRSFTFVCIALVQAIPIISLVALFLL